MKNLLALFLITISQFALCQTQNPFLNLKYDKVVMYEFEGGKGSDLSIIDNKGQLAKSIHNSAILPDSTTKELNEKLGSKKSYGAQTAACFDPHLGFVYYKDEKVVCFITICLDCNRLYSSIEIPQQKQGKSGVGRDIYYTGDGMSDPFRSYLSSLLVKYNFSHQL